MFFAKINRFDGRSMESATCFSSQKLGLAIAYLNVGLFKMVHLLNSALQTNEARCVSASYLQPFLNIQSAVIATILFLHKRNHHKTITFPI